MSDKAGTRVTRIARRTVDSHLPVLVGLMAEEGQEPAMQSERASKLVSLLRRAEVASTLNVGGRAVPLQLEDNGAEHRLIINGEMLARVEDTALAGALAEPVAQTLNISPVAAALVLQVSDEQQLRGLAGRIGAGGEAISPTQIGELVRWRLETFEKRLLDLVSGLGGWLEKPPLSRQEFLEEVSQCPGRWPQWSLVADSAYLSTWRDELSRELDRTDWGEYVPQIGELVWESVAISPHSALRQAAQTVRGFSAAGDTKKLLEVLARVFGDGTPVDDSLGAWPVFEEMVDAWKRMWREEDDALGARRRHFEVPDISVFDRPGEATGFSEPANLPWDEPLLCWSMRERGALRDLFQGMEKTLARGRSHFRVGRLSAHRATAVAPLVNASKDAHWTLKVPRRLPELPEGFSQAVDRSFSALHSSYHLAFANLDETSQQQIIRNARGAYAGYLASTRPIWARRLSSGDGDTLSDHFETSLTALSDAVEWPIFVDAFEEGIDSPAVAPMPRFTVPAVWFEDVDFAPIWIPVEAIGEGLDQAPLRIRNVAVSEEDKKVRWLGDYEIDQTMLGELHTATVLRSIHEGTLLVAVCEV